MLDYFFTPPVLYFVLVFAFLLSVVVYWQRDFLKREIRRWRGKEISVGPVKLERKPDEDKTNEKGTSVGVHFGGDFTDAKVKRIAGRDIRTHPYAQCDGSTPGVEFANNGEYRQAEIKNVAGRDIETED